MTQKLPKQQSADLSAQGDWCGFGDVRAPGVCGELVQGMMGESHFLVTCPIDYFARARVNLSQNGDGLDTPGDCPKSAAALMATLDHLGHGQLSGKLTINSPIPRSKGMGSSSADITATIAATAMALGTELTPETIATIALSVEPSDGVMFPGIALLDHREGSIIQVLGTPPPMEIVALDWGGTVDTVEFNAVDRRSQWKSIQYEVDEALKLVKTGIREQDPGLIGQGASISSRASQAVLFKPQLPEAMEFAEKVGAVGVNIGHSGTIIGILLDARERTGKSVYHKANQAFPNAETINHFRLLSGGIRRVAS